MADFTFQQKLCAGLKAEGWRETDKSAKYRVFVRNGQRQKFFVGVNGALRRGITRSATHSVGDPSHQTPVWLAILQAGERALPIADGAKVRDRIAALREQGAEQSMVPSQEPQADAVEANFDAVPCDTDIPDDEGVSREAASPYDEHDLDGSSHEGGRQ